MINLKSAALVTVAAALLGGCTSFNPAKTHISRTTGEVPFHQHPHHNWWHYKFAYYPKQQVYFEPYSQTYYWFAEGQWEQGPNLPETFSLDPHEVKTVRLLFERPYVQHLSVLMSSWPYSTPIPGSLDDFHTSPEGIAMTEQRMMDRAGMFPPEPESEGFFAVAEPSPTIEVEVVAEAEPAMEAEPESVEFSPFDEDLFTTADPIQETGGLDP